MVSSFAEGVRKMFGKQEIKAFLEEKNIPFDWVEHKAVFTIEEMEELGLESMDEIAKNLFLRDQKGKRHFLVVVKGEKQVNLKELGEKLGTKLSFASEERLEKYLGLKKGAVTPLGVLNDEDCAVEVYFDEELCKMEKIGIHPNENTASVYLSPDDLLHIIKGHGNHLEVLSFV